MPKDGHGHGHGHGKGSESCCSSLSDLGVRQSLSELEFERGIWYAAQWNDGKKVEEFLRKGVLADATDAAGYTALHYAARNGHYEICETLLRHGARANARTRCGGATALHRAATQGHARAVESLLAYGADVDSKDADGYTPLHRALIAARLSVCEILIPRSDLSVVDRKDRTVERLADEYCKDALPLITSRITSEGQQAARE